MENQAFSLSRLTTVYQAEVTAISVSADIMNKAGITDQTIMILSDSQAAIKALASPPSEAKACG